MAKKAKAKKFISKPGVALWPHLVSPDVTFNKNGVYHTKLVYSPEDFKGMKEIIDAEVDAAYIETVDGLKPAQIKKVFKLYPYGPEITKDEEGEEVETGNIALNFKSNASYEDKKTGKTIDLKPALFDAAGNKITRKINIGNGSVLQVSASIAKYSMKADMIIDGKKTKGMNTGITLYINGIMIRKLEEYGASAESMGFETDDEGFVDQGGSDNSEEAKDFDEEAAADGEGDF
jgi:hypothetical protein